MDGFVIGRWVVMWNGYRCGCVGDVGRQVNW